MCLAAFVYGLGEFLVQTIGLCHVWLTAFCKEVCFTVGHPILWTSKERGKKLARGGTLSDGFLLEIEDFVTPSSAYDYTHFLSKVGVGATDCRPRSELSKNIYSLFTINYLQASHFGVIFSKENCATIYGAKRRSGAA